MFLQIVAKYITGGGEKGYMKGLEEESHFCDSICGNSVFVCRGFFASQNESKQRVKMKKITVKDRDLGIE
jgi:hypothetical protein